MLLCSAHQVGISVHDSWLFEKISVEVQEGERLAVIGPNGSGKTTLLRILAKQLNPDMGTVAWAKGARAELLSQIPDFTGNVASVLQSAFVEVETLQKQLRLLESNMSEMTSSDRLERILREYAAVQEQFERLGGYTTESKIHFVMDGLGIPKEFLTREFHQLSGGEQTKVGFARILLREPEILLLDEPTNHLDLPSIEWLEGYLKNYSGAVMIVSHDRYFLNRSATSVLELDSGEAVLYQGNYSDAMCQREARLLQEFQAYQEQQKKIQQMKAAIKRLREWANQSNPPSVGLHRRATSIQRALDRMEKLKRPVLERKQIALSFDAGSRGSQDVVYAENLSKGYDSRDVLKNISLQIRRGERIAVVGSNGSGKSTLIKLLVGVETPDTGTVTVGPSVQAGYLSQQILHADEAISVLEAFRAVAKVETGKARHLLAKFLFYGEAVFKSVRNLSGGERMRLRLAQLMHQDINLLILDEPTNHLDIESRETLEAAIEDFPGTVIAVSHDRHFINLLFHRILWLENGSITSYLGNYDEARAKRSEAAIARDS